MAVVLASLVLLGAPATAFGWTQNAGGPSNSGLVTLGDAPLDVLTYGNVLPEGQILPGGCCELFDAGAAGIWAMHIALPGSTQQASSGTLNTCSVASIDMALARHPLVAYPCPNGGHLVAYLPRAGLLIVSRDGRPALPSVAGVPVPAPPTGSPLDADSTLEVRALSASTGQVVWTWVPNVIASTPGANDDNDFACAAGVADEDAGFVVLGCSDEIGDNVVARLALADGKPRWNRTVSKPLVAPGVGPVDSGLAPQPVQGRMTLDGLTLVGDNVVAKGRVIVQSHVGWYAAMAWLDTKSGGQVGYVEDDASAATQSAVTAQAGAFGGSAYAASDGKQAAAVIGNQLRRVTPGISTATTDDGMSLPASLGDAAGPAWGHETLVVPTQTSAYVVSTVRHGPLPLWPGGGRIGQVVIDRDRSAYATLQVAVANGSTEARLARFGLPVPDPLSWVPVPRLRTTIELAPAAPGAPAVAPAHPHPPRILWRGDDRLIVYDDFGNMAVLGPRPPMPGFTATPSSFYPAVGDEVRLDLHIPAGTSVRQVLVGWGDGDVNPWQGNETPTTLYNAAGDYTVRTTLVLADNTTATVQADIHPGRTAPNLNFFQKAFLPENQNYTFFSIGLFLTLFGTVLAAIGASRGRRRLAKYLRRLDAIQEAGRRDAFDATRRLHAFREECRLDLAKGKLDNAQFTVLESRSTGVLQLLRQRVLGSFLGRTSERFNHALDTALQDGSIDPAESRALEEAVRHEKGLAAGERAALAQLVRSWTRPGPDN